MSRGLLAFDFHIESFGAANQPAPAGDPTLLIGYCKNLIQPGLGADGAHITVSPDIGYLINFPVFAKTMIDQLTQLGIQIGLHCNFPEDYGPIMDIVERWNVGKITPIFDGVQGVTDITITRNFQSSAFKDAMVPITGISGAPADVGIQRLSRNLPLGTVNDPSSPLIFVGSGARSLAGLANWQAVVGAFPEPISTYTVAIEPNTLIPTVGGGVLAVVQAAIAAAAAVGVEMATSAEAMEQWIATGCVPSRRPAP